MPLPPGVERRDGLGPRTRRDALSRALGWALAILGGVVITVAVEGGMVGGWPGAVLVGLGTLAVSVGVNMVAFDLRHAKWARRRRGE